MTWNSRLDVAEALEAAGWTGDTDNPLGLLRHPSGAVWTVTSDAGDCDLDTPGACVVDFPGDVPDSVVIAACLAAAGQLAPQPAAVSTPAAESEPAGGSALAELVDVFEDAGARSPEQARTLAAALLTKHARELGALDRPGIFREAAHAVRPDAFGWGGPDHEDAWTAAVNKLNQLAAGAPADSYPPALPWAQLMDDEDLSDFLGEIWDAARADHRTTPRQALDAVEKACGTWRAIAEAQHAHNTAPGPDQQ